MKIPLWLRSSADPKKISLTLKWLAPLILSLGVKYGFNIESTDIDEGIAAIVAIASAAGVLYGLARKFK